MFQMSLSQILLILCSLAVTKCSNIWQDDMLTGDFNKPPETNNGALSWYLRYYDEFYCQGDDWTDVPPNTQCEDAVASNPKGSAQIPKQDSDVQPSGMHKMQQQKQNSSQKALWTLSWFKSNNNTYAASSNESNKNKHFLDCKANAYIIRDSEDDAVDEFHNVPGRNSSNQILLIGKRLFYNIFYSIKHLGYDDEFVYDENLPNNTKLDESTTDDITSEPLNIVNRYDYDDYEPLLIENRTKRNVDDIISAGGNRNKPCNDRSRSIDGSRDLQTSGVNTEVSLRQLDDIQLHNGRLPAELWKYFSPPLVLGGTVGNILTLCLLSRKRFIKKPVTLYLIFLAITDTALLDVNLSYRWIKVVFNFDMKLISDATCKLYTCGIYLLHGLTSWMIVLATVDRCLTLFYPWWARDIFSRACSAVLIGITSLIIVIFNVHFLLTQELFLVYNKQTGESVKTCNTYLQSHRWFVHCIWPWVDLSLFAVVQFAIVIMCNGCIMGQFVIFCVTQKETIATADLAADTETETHAGTSALQERNKTQTPTRLRPKLRPDPQSSSTLMVSTTAVCITKAKVLTANVAAPIRNEALSQVPVHQKSSPWKPKLAGTTKMVILISSGFVFMNLPLCVVLMGQMNWLTGASDEKKEMLHITWVIAHLVANAFSACKFVFYWCISSKFRKSFRWMFQSRRVAPGHVMMDDLNNAENETVF